MAARGADVEVLGIEWDAKVQAVPNPGYRFVAVHVRVTSRVQKVRLHLRPERFSVRTAKGARFRPLQSQRVEPFLPTLFLNKGQEIEGWLTFQLPHEAAHPELVSDLAIPPMVLALPGA